MEECLQQVSEMTPDKRLRLPASVVIIGIWIGSFILIISWIR